MPTLRPDLEQIAPYVSPQLPARLRLNTNESPYAALGAEDETMEAVAAIVSERARVAARLARLGLRPVRTGALLGVQFHPEKSGRDGIALLRSWVQEAA